MSNNSTVLQKVRDMIGDPKRLIVMMALIGCINSSFAKNVFGNIKSVDGEKVELATNEGDLRITSPALVKAVTKAHNKKGGDLSVKLTFDESTSTGISGVVYHGRIDLYNGVKDAVRDIRDVYDDIHEVYSEGKDININRVLRKASEMGADLSQDAFRDDNGIVRKKAQNPDGAGFVYAQYHKVDRNGFIKNMYLKNNSNNGNNGGYSQSASSSGGRSFHYERGNIPQSVKDRFR